MRNIVSRALMTGLLPTAVVTSLLAATLARHLGTSMETAILVCSFATLGLAMALERTHPLHTDWNQSRGDTATDWLSFAVVGGLVDPVLKWATPLIVIAAYGAWAAAPPSAWPFADSPWLAQVVVVTLLAELGKYWGHRAHHAIPALWWLHALHHGSERLYTINNFRVHPLEYAIKHAFSLLPLMLLGVPTDALLGYIALTQPVVMLQHANLPLRHGWLNWVFSTNALHRWHHSTERTEGDSNFGSAIVLWDQVFGTFRPMELSEGPARVGLYAGSTYPAQRSFGAQLISMFQPCCCKA